jgi:hypothetical protein
MTHRATDDSAYCRQMYLENERALRYADFSDGSVEALNERETEELVQCLEHADPILRERVIAVIKDHVIVRAQEKVATPE